MHIWWFRESDLFDLRISDAKRYTEWAAGIAAGDWIGDEIFYQAPLYPYFLAVIFKFLGADLLMVRLCQALGGALACGFLSLAGCNLFGRRAGLIAGLVMAFYAPAIFFDGVIGKSTLDLLFLCLALWTLSLLTLSPSLPRWWAAGVAIGAFTLTRENGLLLAFGVAAWGVIHYWSLGVRRFACIGAFAAGTACMLLPVSFRNYHVGGEFQFSSSQFGRNLFYGNNENAYGSYSYIQPGRGEVKQEREDATRLAEEAEGRSLTPGQVSSYWTGQALDYIGGNPVEWIALKLRTLAWTWKAVELVDTEDQYVHADYSPPLRLCGTVFHFGVIAPIALWGILVTWDRRRELWLLYLLLAVYTATVVIFWVFARFRYPLVPILVLFAAVGLDRIRVAWTTYSKQRLAGYVAVVVAFAAFSNWTPADAAIPIQKAITHYNIGLVMRRSGAHEKALEHYELALRYNPNEPGVRINLGSLLSDLGRFDQAIEHLLQATQLVSWSPDPQVLLGNAYLQIDRLDEAIAHYRRALELAPGDQDARFRLEEAQRLKTQRAPSIPPAGRTPPGIQW
jgi:tetratricopeptide (TPR) repeat protein